MQNASIPKAGANLSKITLDNNGLIRFVDGMTTLEQMLALMDMQQAIEQQAADLLTKLSERYMEEKDFAGRFSRVTTRSVPV